MDHWNGSNRLLGGLTSIVRAAVARAAAAVPLANGSTLAQAGEPTGHVHFVEAGFLSVLCGEGAGVEVGLIGREGLSGSWLALGRETAPFRVVVQGAGTAVQMPGHAFRRACADHPELQAAVLAYAQDFTAAVAETCRANTCLTIEERLARWLLLVRDRLDTDELSITHETLSRMLGVRRPGVTVALHVLEGEHMVKARRGTIRILGREKLRATAEGVHRPGRAAGLRPAG